MSINGGIAHYAFLIHAMSSSFSDLDYAQYDLSAYTYS